MLTLYDELEAHKRHKDSSARVFGLVIQGGGMRGAYSAAAIVPLIAYGFSDTFDHVIGSSAGAINGAYFVSAKDETLRHTYADDLANKKFINLLRRDKRVDIDFLVDGVLKHERALDINALNAAHAKLHIVMTDAKTSKEVVLSDHGKFLEIYEELRATAALPILYDKEVRVNDRLYIDGGVSDLLPIDVAIKLGCTDIVVIMTQQIRRYSFVKRHERLVNHLVKYFAKDKPVRIRKKLPTDEHKLQRNLRKLSHPTKNLRFYVLEPSDEEFLVSLATSDRDKVESLAKLGVSDMDKFLHEPLETRPR